MLQQHLPFTVLKPICTNPVCSCFYVATTPTVYGIETGTLTLSDAVKIGRELQQHLPFTVLKQKAEKLQKVNGLMKLQQHLPFTVLKPRMS